MAVEINKNDDAMVKEFLKDIRGETQLVKHSGDDKPRGPDSYVVKLGGEGDFKVSHRRRRSDANLMEDIKKAWITATDRTTDDLLRKFDALGFQLDRVGGKDIDIVLKLPVKNSPNEANETKTDNQIPA